MPLCGAISASYLRVPGGSGRPCGLGLVGILCGVGDAERQFLGPLRRQAADLAADPGDDGPAPTVVAAQEAGVATEMLHGCGLQYTGTDRDLVDDAGAAPASP